MKQRKNAQISTTSQWFLNPIEKEVFELHGEEVGIWALFRCFIILPLCITKYCIIKIMIYKYILDDSRVTLVDLRAASKDAQTFKCHKRLIRTVQFHPENDNYFLTANSSG